MKSKKMFALILGMLVMGTSMSTMAQNQVKVTINNEQVSFDEAGPFVDGNSRTLVPLRFISEKLGAQVKWDGKAGKVTVIGDNQEAVLTVGQAQMTVNGQKKTMDTKPVMKDGRVFVPVKYVSEVLGADVKWDAKTSTVAITDELPGAMILAKVNDETVTAREVTAQLNYELTMMQYQYNYDSDFFESETAKDYIKQRKSEIVDYIIKNKVALIKGKELKLEPTALQVDEQFNAIKAQYTSEADFEEALSNAKLTPKAYKAQIRDSLTISNVMKEIEEKVTATDAEIKAYYEAHIAEYTNEAGANMYHILVETEEEAKAVKAEYDKGAGFAELAAKYGMDGTKDNGGALGYIPYDSMYYDKDFLNGAKALEEGQVSEPVKTQFGWHIIKVDNVHKQTFTTPLEKVKEKIKEMVISEKSTPAIYSKLEEWEKEMTVEKYEELIDKL